MKYKSFNYITLVTITAFLGISCRNNHRPEVGSEKSKEEFAKEVDRQWPIRIKKFTGILFLTKGGYLAVRLQKPIIVNPWTNEETVELQLIPFDDDMQWIKACEKVGSKVWIKGSVGPRKTQYYELDSVVLVKEIKYL